LGVGAFWREREIGVELGIIGPDALEEIGGKFARGGFLRSEGGSYVVNGPVGGHDFSETLS